VTGILAAVTPAGTIKPPSIEYGQLSPMLVVFGAAVVGILVEAFSPRPLRRTIQLVITLGSILAAFVLTIVAASFSIFKNGSPGHIAAAGAVAVDRPTLFIQGTILVLAFVSVLLIADTSNSPFAAQAAAPPGKAPQAAPGVSKPAATKGAGAGTRLQLGSVRGEEEARQEWERVKRKNADLLGTLSATPVRADLGDKGIYYRILTGPVADQAAAERICSELKQRSIGCIIAR